MRSSTPAPRRGRCRPASRASAAAGAGERRRTARRVGYWRRSRAHRHPERVPCGSDSLRRPTSPSGRSSSASKGRLAGVPARMTPSPASCDGWNCAAERRRKTCAQFRSRRAQERGIAGRQQYAADVRRGTRTPARPAAGDRATDRSRPRPMRQRPPRAPPGARGMAPRANPHSSTLSSAVHDAVARARTAIAVVH